MEVRDQFHAPASLTSGKEPPVPIGWMAGLQNSHVRPEEELAVTLQCEMGWDD